MAKNTPPPIRIGIYGSEETFVSHQRRGCALWAPGYANVVAAAGAAPRPLQLLPGCSWDEVLNDVEGVVFTSQRGGNGRHQAEEERLCHWCRELRIPILAVDHGLHVLNTTFGGTLYLDLPSEVPDALQHQHPDEDGIRHAIAVTPDTRIAHIYGDGEIIVNSKHRQGICRVAPGFIVGARALDGVIESIEPESDDWFALGVQWRPAAASASGLDIQLFRALIEACEQRRKERVLDDQFAAA
ncbi:MAG: gamma-glutamyl-gamma-aminobutyrate hydrolase family protein [Gemmataceae bacterium]